MKSKKYLLKYSYSDGTPWGEMTLDEESLEEAVNLISKDGILTEKIDVSDQYLDPEKQDIEKAKTLETLKKSLDEKIQEIKELDPETLSEKELLGVVRTLLISQKIEKGWF